MNRDNINNISFEIKLQTTSDILQSNETLSSKFFKQTQSHSIKNHEFTVIHQTLQDDEKIIIHSSSPVYKQNQIEINTCSNHSNTLHELLNELHSCQEKQAYLIKQLTTNKQKFSSEAFFLPLNSLNNQSSLSLQDAFQQRKSSFIEQSKKRVKQIYHCKIKSHHRIIPNIKQTNNTYLQERRKYENDRLCTMIIKQQNRKNSKIYGNFIKNQLCHN